MGISLAVVLAAGPVPANKPAHYPDWWFERDVIPLLPAHANNPAPVWPDHYPVADDYAVANLGQLKHIATAADAALDASLPGGSGPEIDGLVGPWSMPPAAGVARDDFAAVNLGQLKYVATSFYDRLAALDPTIVPPWGAGAADDYALSNIGQLKNVFAFDLSQWGEASTLIMIILDGAAQVAAPGVVASKPLMVGVYNEQGQPVAGVGVSFSTIGAVTLGADSNHATSTALQSLTDSNGVARVYGLPSGLPGSVAMVAANAAGQTVYFQLTLAGTVNSAGGVAQTPPPLANPALAPGGNPQWSSNDVFLEDYIASRSVAGGVTISPKYDDDGSVDHSMPTVRAYLTQGSADSVKFEWRINGGDWIFLSYGPISAEHELTNLLSGNLYEFQASFYKNGRIVGSARNIYSLPIFQHVTGEIDTGSFGVEPIESWSTNVIGFGWGEFSRYSYNGETGLFLMNYLMNYSATPYPSALYSVSMVEGGYLYSWWWEEDGAFDHPSRHFTFQLGGSPLAGTPDYWDLTSGIGDASGFFDLGVGVESSHYIALNSLYGGQTTFAPESLLKWDLSSFFRIIASGPDTHYYWVDLPPQGRTTVITWTTDQAGHDVVTVTDENGVTLTSPVSISLNKSVTVTRKAGYDGSGRGFRMDVVTPNSIGSYATVILPDIPPLDTVGTSIPHSESAGAQYRKISLSGAPLTDAKPQQNPESDMADESTFVDALTLSLRHETTDVYSPVATADLALSVRRNVTPEIWHNRRGMRPQERPDRPFGYGWTSNLSSNIHFTTRLGSARADGDSVDTATVTDENGVEYTFAILYASNSTYTPEQGYSGPRTFVPLPSSLHEQSIYLTSLTESTPGVFTFKRRYGTTLTFSLMDYAVSFAADRVYGSSSGEKHSYARLDRVQDRFGNILSYAYSASNTLIPATITALGTGAKISIYQNALGQVEKVWDPMGNLTVYSYVGGKLLKVTHPDLSETHYGYSEATDPDLTPQTDPVESNRERFYGYLDLEEIRTGSGETTTFSYEFDRSKSDYHTTHGYYTKTGLPRQISQVIRPNDSVTTFANESQNLRLRLAQGVAYLEPSALRRTSVIDALGHQRVYTFGDAQVESMPDFATLYRHAVKLDQPKMIFFRSMLIESYTGNGPSRQTIGSESYRFTPSAGMALSESTDHSGNKTSYFYQDAYPGRSLYDSTGLASGILAYYSDPTSQTNALGKTKYFTYHPVNRVMTSSTDENGVKTHWTVDELGRRTEEKIYPAGSTTPVQWTDFAYENPTFPNFLTKKTLRKLATAADSDPVWVTDLVTLYEPDAQGRVHREIVDMNGNGTIEPATDLVTSYTYDANGNKLTTTDPRGYTTTFSYDRRNRLTHVTYPDAHQKRFFYDARGNKTEEIDENGNSTLWRYDALNRVRDQIIDMDGTLQALAAANNHVLPDSVTPDRSIHIVTSHTYDDLNAVLTTTNPKGTVTKFTYDALRRLTQKTEDYGTAPGSLNYITTYEYDRAKNPGGSTFDSSGFKPTKVTDPRGYTTEITYDKLYRPLEEKVQYTLSPAAYAITLKAYDDVGNLTQVTAPRATVGGVLQATGTITRTAYDALRRPTSVTQAYGLGALLEVTNRTDYTSTGLVWRTIADAGDATRLNRTTTTEYDRAGRPVKVFAPAVDDALTPAPALVSPVTETRYDLAGNVAYVIDPLGRRTDYTYDPRNRRQTEQLPAVPDATTGQTSRPVRTTAYDGVGNLIAVQDARGYITTTEYDHARRPWRVTAPAVLRPDGTTAHPVTASTYDTAGNILTVTDALGRVTTNTYDALSRLKTTLQKPDLATPAKDILVTNEYDPAGNRTAVIDGKLQRTEFTYDGLNRNTSIKDPAGRSVTQIYDAVNKIARVDSENRRTDYIYDARRRLTAVSYVGRSQDNRAYAYDLLDQLLSVTEPGKGGLADVAYTYDALGRQLTETSVGRQHTYGYDLANNRVTVTYGGTGTVLTSTYDAHNRLDTLSEQPATGAPRLTTYGYDLSGNRVLLRLPNGEETDTQYDPLNRAFAITTSKATGALLLQLTQTYDLVGNLRKLTERHYGSTLKPRTVTNDYDDVNRLVLETHQEGTAKTIATTYRFDQANNRTAKIVATTVAGAVTTETTDYIYNNLNQLVTATTAPPAAASFTTGFTYDLNGNRSTRTQGGQTDTYTYDYDNRLVGLTKNTPEGTGTYAYTYDYRTRRVQRVENGATTRIVFSGGVSIAEYPAASPSPAAEYVRGSDWGGGVGGLLYSVRSGEPSFKHYNSRGDVISATDAAGTATWQAHYEAFGRRTAEQGTTLDRQKANTKEEDPTGLLNEGFRYRCLETGVFITRDPLGFVDGPNMYAYVVQNPWSKFDPEGLWLEDLFIAVPSIALGAKSLYDNVKSGNIRGAIVDSAGIVADVGAAALPGVPGGAGLAIKAARATVSVAQKVEKVGMVVDGVEATVGAAQNGDGLGLVTGVASATLGAKADVPGGKTAKTTQQDAKALAKTDDAAKSELHRPYIRKDVKAEVNARAPKTADGRPIDPNTLQPIDGKPDLGHKTGHEFRTEKAKAEAEGLNQKQFNDRMNNPDLYQLEDPSSNRSHRYEKK